MTAKVEENSYLKNNHIRFTELAEFRSVINYNEAELNSPFRPLGNANAKQHYAFKGAV